MATGILASQFSAILTSLITLLLSVGLSVTITRRYAIKRHASLAFWAAGLWLFSIGVLMELIFAFGVYSGVMMRAYLLLVAVLVELLALGSMQLSRSRPIKRAYYAFSLASTAFLVYSVLESGVNSMIIDYVVAGQPPVLVTIASTLVTIPAAIVLVASAYVSYRARKDIRMLSIIAGVIVVSVTGALYIVQYPAFLYLAEVIGIGLLWYGFV